MDLNFTSEQKLIRETARKFAEAEIAPVARENDLKENFPREIITRMGQAGLLGGPIPEIYGGANIDYIAYALLIEEIGKVCSSVRTTLSVQVSLAAMTIFKWGSEDQKKKYLPPLLSGDLIGCFGLTEPEAGSDVSNQSTQAKLSGKNWVINGVKTWISNAGVADVAIVFAQTEKAKGAKGLAAFIVEKGTKGFSPRNITGKLGLRSSNTAQIFLDDCTVPEENILSQPGDGFKIAMSALDSGRFSVAAGCVGISQACLETSVKYAKQRKQFGREIGGFQLVQEMIARMAVETEAARLLVCQAGALKNEGKRSTKETSMAKYFASEAAMRAATDAVQIHGGYGYSNEYPVERYFRDAKVATIYEGTSQIQKLIIGRELLGIEAFR